MKLPEKKQRWVYHAEALPQTAGEGVTRRVLAYTDGLMCVENTFCLLYTSPSPRD